MVLSTPPIARYVGSAFRIESAETFAKIIVKAHLLVVIGIILNDLIRGDLLILREVQLLGVGTSEGGDASPLSVFLLVWLPIRKWKGS